MKFTETKLEQAFMKSIKQSDESYIIDLCDEVLKQSALKQHWFDFLRGDSGSKLPVDAYYPALNLVIEFREKQHTEEVKFFNKRQTVSGVGRNCLVKVIKNCFYSLTQFDLQSKCFLKFTYLSSG